jgi:hypothetical protein
MARTDEARVSGATRDAERREAKMKGDAGRPPTDDEIAVADAHGPADPDVARSNAEANERGANAKGEGRIA